MNSSMTTDFMLRGKFQEQIAKLIGEGYKLEYIRLDYLEAKLVKKTLVKSKFLLSIFNKPQEISHFLVVTYDTSNDEFITKAIR